MATEETKLRKLVTSYRYFAFNIPRVVTSVGVLLLAGLAGALLYLWLGDFEFPAYLAVYFALSAGGCLVASILLWATPALITLGWVLGDVMSTVFVVGYVVSRLAGLPGAPELKAWWDFPAGTFGMLFAGLFVATHFSILTKVNIAYPQQRNWHE